MTLSVQFLGATGTVTGSRYLVSADAGKFLVDCGLFQGIKQLRLRNWAPLIFDAKSLHGVVLTHAHIDHSGYLPLLVKNGFAGPIYCTPATVDLCSVLLPDAGRLQEEEAEHANRHGWSKHVPALPLYTEADALAALKQLVPREPHSVFQLAGCSVEFRNAGHILGAAGVLVREKASVYFSGDVGRRHDLIMRAPEPPPSVDYLVVESTYGNRLHEASDPMRALGEIIRRTSARRGVAIIPAFSVGRAQSILYCISELKKTGQIDGALPVYLNSPMATDVTRSYAKYSDQHALSEMDCAAMCGAATIIRTADESRHLNTLQEPMVIIAGSGMATGGRIVHHLAAFAPDARNAIVLAGFQAAGTRGAALLAGAKSIKIHGEYVPVRAEVAELTNLSAHADQRELLDWLSTIPHPPRKTFITHGEPAASDALRKRVEEELKWTCEVPAQESIHEMSLC